MKSDCPARLRIFAGSNGSGKSAVKAEVPYVFDNLGKPGNQQIWIAEITGGTEIEIKCDELPNWFKTTVWDNLGNDQT